VSKCAEEKAGKEKSLREREREREAHTQRDRNRERKQDTHTHTYSRLLLLGLNQNLAHWQIGEHITNGLLHGLTCSND
jgi:hypothetical protein